MIEKYRHAGVVDGALVQWKMRDGRVRNVRVFGHVIDEGAQVGFDASVVDVTSIEATNAELARTAITLDMVVRQVSAVYWLVDKELRIIERKVPGLDARLARELAGFMEKLRQMRLAKVPGVAETLDWAHALAALHADHLDQEVVGETLGCVLKDADDIKRFRAEVVKTGLTPFLPAQP